MLPAAVQDFEALARSCRPWSRTFQVESPQGDRIYRKLRGVAGSNIPVAVHESVERLPAGIQMYNPRPGAQPDDTPTTKDSDCGGPVVHPHIVVSVENGALEVADKLRLTMALMSPTRQVADTLPREGQPAAVLTVVAQGDAEARSVVAGFLVTLLGTELDHDPTQLERGARTWEALLSDGTLLLVSSPKPSALAAIAKERCGEVAIMPQKV